MGGLEEKIGRKKHEELLDGLIKLLNRLLGHLRSGERDGRRIEESVLERGESLVVLAQLHQSICSDVEDGLKIEMFGLGLVEEERGLGGEALVRDHKWPLPPLIQLQLQN